MKCDRCYNNILKQTLCGRVEYCMEYEFFLMNLGLKDCPVDEKFDFEKCEKFVPKKRKAY